jgi:signal transduction histidine kinase
MKDPKKPNDGKRVKQILDAVFASMDDGLCIINRDHQIVMANKGILNIFGKQYLPENQGKKCFEEFQEGKAICSDCPAERTFKEGIFTQLHGISRDIGSKKLVINHAAFPVRDTSGDITHAVIWFKDVTDVVKLQEQLLSSERLASLGKLAAGIAHEIRNPLGSIKATAQFCLSKYELRGRMRKHLKVILKSSDRVNKVVKNLLNLAKPGEASFSVDHVDKVVNSTCSLIKAKCLKQRVRLAKRSSKRLPPVLMDSKLIEEAFLNFMLNALDAMPKGGRLAVITCYDPDTEEIAISFIDSGCGISEGHLDRIFDPFFTTKKDGTGLGLSVALRIIDLHKGNVRINSRPGCGTEITVRLPAYEGDCS